MIPFYPMQCDILQLMQDPKVNVEPRTGPPGRPEEEEDSTSSDEDSDDDEDEEPMSEDDEDTNSQMDIQDMPPYSE